MVERGEVIEMAAQSWSGALELVEPLELVEGFPMPAEVAAVLKTDSVVRCEVSGGVATWEVFDPDGTKVYPPTSEGSLSTSAAPPAR